ncbi:amidohydrolase family protein [Rhodococcus sp. JS3073]|uniref:amidohydrolase family protein n=1 Tax=Rhodococcus sp. JS3073 TaxID=3002901 RepID=UPI002286758A|nr:amidohydrolase family protein [Rhodococcus sp. JS3073]WAM15407.1 amidohydrolase family protein [Rhodococcus sp. JS3073]
MTAENTTVTVFRDVRPFGGAVTDLIAVNGALAQNIPDGVAVDYVDGHGKAAVPTLVDAHIHPDKTAWGEPWYSRRTAHAIEDLVAGDVELHHAQPTPVADRALRLMAHAVTLGTRAMRAHVDVAPAYGLAGVEAVATARDALRHAMDVQIVAFPQHGVERTPGTAALLEMAADSGLIDVIGGIDPAGFDHTPGGTGGGARQLDTVFGIAERHGLPIDIHLHDTGETGTATLTDIAERTRAAGLQGRVTVSHAFAVAELSGHTLDSTANLLAMADIALTTAALSTATVLPFRLLAQHGVRVGLGSDGVRDNWSPFGDADMLHRAWLLGWALDARLDEDLEACYELAADGGAAVMGLPRADLQPGSPADFMLLDGECVPQIVVDVPRRDTVVRAGRVVARDGILL